MGSLEFLTESYLFDYIETSISTLLEKLSITLDQQEISRIISMTTEKNWQEIMVNSCVVSLQDVCKHSSL